MATGVVVYPRESASFVKERRKHRYTLFIGYGESAGSLLKRFEQLKCRLGISTNIEFLKYLVEFLEENRPDDFDANTVESTTICNPQPEPDQKVYLAKTESSNNVLEVSRIESSNFKNPNFTTPEEVPSTITLSVSKNEGSSSILG